MMYIQYEERRPPKRILYNFVTGVKSQEIRLQSSTEKKIVPLTTTNSLSRDKSCFLKILLDCLSILLTFLTLTRPCLRNVVACPEYILRGTSIHTSPDLLNYLKS